MGHSCSYVVVLIIDIDAPPPVLGLTFAEVTLYIDAYLVGLYVVLVLGL